MYGGPNNQRMCFKRGLAHAKRQNYTLVLPSWRQDFWSGGESVLLPFSYFYSIDSLTAYTASVGVPVVEEMPPDRMAACVTQLGHVPHPSDDDEKRWSELYGVVCLQPDHTFFKIGHDWSHSPAMRDSLVPSLRFEREVDRVMDALRSRFGTSDFVAVHARVEDDFRADCPATAKKEMMEGAGKVECYVSEAEIARALHEWYHIQEGMPLFVSSNAKPEDMPSLCSLFRCFSLEDVWAGPGEGIADTFLSRAFLRFVVALRSQAMYGNIYSTFYVEMWNDFHRTGRPSGYYNPVCADVENCG